MTAAASSRAATVRSSARHHDHPPADLVDRAGVLPRDFYVAPEPRGHGVGRALLARLAERAPAEGWARLYSMTQAGNAPAQARYGSFAAAHDFVRYVIRFDDAATAGA